MADIHFAPAVALRVAECFDKIRVNPGNFGTVSSSFVSHLFLQLKHERFVLAFVADRRAQFETIEYTEDEYQKELQHIEQVERKHLFYLMRDL